MGWTLAMCLALLIPGAEPFHRSPLYSTRPRPAWARAAAPRLAPRAAADGAPGGESIHALVVDDDASLRRAVAAYLRDQDFYVTEAASAQEAIAALAGGPGTGVPGAGDPGVSARPDALVLDVMMPGVTGLELLRRLRATPGAGDLPVVLLTARGFKQDRIDGYRAGCSAYLTKPFDPDELAAILRGVVANYRRLVARGAGPGEQAAAAVPSPESPDPSAPGPPPWLASLTPREAEVLDLVSQGRMNKEIARQLEISPRMVEKYVSRLLAKAGAATRTELARRAVDGLSQRPG